MEVARGGSDMARANPGLSSVQAVAGSLATGSPEVRIQIFPIRRSAGTQPATEQLILLMIVAQEWAGQLEEGRISGDAARGLSERCQFQIDVAI